MKISYTNADAKREFPTHGDARKFCEQYGMPVRGNDDVWMLAAALKRAYLDGQKAAAPSLLETLKNIVAALKLGSKTQQYFNLETIVPPLVEMAETAIARAEEGRE